MNKKYVFTKECKKLLSGTVVHRIKALRDFGHVKKGDLGGWIESEDNLSHDGNCWVFDEAEACGNARVCEEAKVYDKARVFGNALVYGKAEVYDEARVYCNAEVSGEACVYDKAVIIDRAYVYDKARVCGDARVCGAAEIGGNAVVKSICDYTVFKNTWSSGRWFTYTSSNKMWSVGCFYGTGKELIAKAKKDSKLSGKCYALIVKAAEALEKCKAVRKRVKVSKP